MIGERIKQSREALKYTQKEFAVLFGMSSSSVAHWEIGDREVPIDVLDKLASEYEINSDWLLTGRGEMFRDGSGQDGIVYLPVLDAKVSAGYGFENFEVSVKDKFGIESKLIFPYSAERLKVIPVKGDSMFPTLIEGDYIVVAEGVIDGNGIYVLNRGGQLFVKRIQFKLTEKKLSIISDNRNYPAEEIAEEQAREFFVIVGMVVLHIHRSR